MKDPRKIKDENVENFLVLDPKTEKKNFIIRNTDILDPGFNLPVDVKRVVIKYGVKSIFESLTEDQKKIIMANTSENANNFRLYVNKEISFEEYEKRRRSLKLLDIILHGLFTLTHENVFFEAPGKFYIREESGKLREWDRSRSSLVIEKTPPQNLFISESVKELLFYLEMKPNIEVVFAKTQYS